MDLKLLLRAQRDRVGAILCIVAGAVALLAGWIGVSGNALVYKQLAYIASGGLFGISLIGVGTTLWLSADLTDEWRKLDRVEEALRSRLAGDPPPTSAAVTMEAGVRPLPDATDETGVLPAPRPRRRPAPAAQATQATQQR